MTKQLPVSALEPIFFDAMQVDETDLTTEQQANDAITSSIINNQFGSGVLAQTLEPKVIFDSSLTGNAFLDGYAISAQNQPSDITLGNQLVISLTNSTASGQRQVKVCIIGLDFQDNLQYEIFYFKTNETQISKKHFTNVLTILFNDFVGNQSTSFNLGGQIVISEAQAMALSRDVIMLAQDQQPNLFFADFVLDLDGYSLATFLSNALPLYDVSTLGIYDREEDIYELTALPDPLTLTASDVTTQYGQKFQASTNNIQKVTLLLSVDQTVSAWTGDLVVSIFPLQTNLECPTDFVPNLPIDYSPYNVPLAQISYNYTTLQAAGIVLSTVAQPVDFIFSNTPIAGGNLIVPEQYYAVTLKRSGSNNIGNIKITVGNGILDNSRVTMFSPTGNIWVDNPDLNLWFRIWTDAAKVSDGQAYDAGHGITIPKTITDPTTQATIDNSFGLQQFVSNQTYSAVLSAVTEASVLVEDQRTARPINSRQQYVPQISLLDEIDMTNLQAASEPLVLGNIADANIKTFNPSQANFTIPLYAASIIDDYVFIKVITDQTDKVRYNQTISSTLMNELLSGNLFGAQVTIANDGYTYRIADAELDTMLIGDVNGDGIIDSDDVALLYTFLGYNLNVGLPYQISMELGSPSGIGAGYQGTNTLFPDGYYGYQSITQPFVTDGYIYYQLVDLANDGYVVEDGYGDLQIDSNDLSIAYFASTTNTVPFSTIIGNNTYNLAVFDGYDGYANYGAWNIIGWNVDPTGAYSSGILMIQKIYLTPESMAQILRADIDGDFVITNNDGYLLESYVERQQSATSITPSYPAPTTDPFSLIGTHFSFIKLRLEKFTDRADDYLPGTYTTEQRNEFVHPVQDIFTNDYASKLNTGLATYQFTTPGQTTQIVPPAQISMQIIEQIVWDASLVISNSQPRLVPSVFTSETGLVTYPCSLDGVTVNRYPQIQEFDPGLVDFFVPNNLIIGSGDIQRPDGDFYKVDFEIGTIVLEVPDGLFGTEKTIDIMGDFISTSIDANGVTGLTRLGYPAMRFSDCSFVTADALANDQLRFSVAVQSFSPNTNGLSTDGYTGTIVDGKMGVSIDFSTGLLTLNFTNLYQDPVLQTLSTKVQVTVFLKKGGFNNTPLFVDSSQMSNMLELISVFSGANEGTPFVTLPAYNVTYTPTNDGYWLIVPQNVQNALDYLAAHQSGNTFTAGGDLSGTTSNQTVIGIDGKTLPSLPVSDGYLNYTGSAWAYSTISIPTTLPPSGSAGGDLSGTYPSPTVAKLQGVSVSSSAPSTSQVLEYNGTSWAPTNLPSSLPPNGTAGGDLSGTYPSPSVKAIQGITISATAPHDGYVLIATSSSAADWETLPVNAITQLTGDVVAGPGLGSQVTTVEAIQGVAISGTPSDGYILTATSSSAANWAQFPSTINDLISADITIIDGSIFKPTTVAPVTVNQSNAIIVSAQTTSNTPIVALTVPLPGTSGSPITLSGTNTGLITFDVTIRMQSTTTADAAWFKYSWAWSVLTYGSPVPLGASANNLLSIGTNSGAPPTGWAATIALDGSSHNITISITGNAALIVDATIQAEWSDLQ
jgi:hypothetical protein